MYNMCYKTVLNFKQMSCSAHTGQHLHMQASCRALQLLGECNALWSEREQARFMFVCTLLYTLLINPPAHICAAKCYSVRLSFTVTLVICYVINPRRACAARVTVVVLCVCLSVCLFVCLSVSNCSRTTGHEAAYERYQQLQCYKGKKNDVTISLKRLRSRDMA